MIRPLQYLTLLLLPVLGGCNLLGFAAATVGNAPDVAARYSGLAGQRVGVMTWADRAAIFHYSYMGSDIRSDTSSAIAERLRTAAAPKSRNDELSGTQVVDARQIYRWQRNFPASDNMPAADVAPQIAAAIPMTRLVHVELQDFMTRDPNTEMLLRGHAVVNIRVIEIDPSTRAARQTFEELGVPVSYPPKAPEGVPPTSDFTEQTVRRGLIEEIATTVAVRFFTHQPQ